MDFSEEMTDKILQIFQVETEEIIAKLNNSLLDLEKNPSNMDAILLLFRDAHTLKGASRMVGFTSIQAVAHKMEDVLGYAKDGEIHLNSKIVDVLYRTVDFLSELIKKSVEKGKDVNIEGMTALITELENIKNLEEESNSENSLPEFDVEQFASESERVNSLIVDCIYLLMEIDKTKKNELINELNVVISEIYDIFTRTGLYEVKKGFEDIKVKLAFTVNGANVLTSEEVQDLYHNLDSIMNKFISICELYNIRCPDYYSKAFEKSEIIASEKIYDEHEVKEEQSVTDDFIGESPFFNIELNEIIAKIDLFSKGSVSTSEIINNLSDYGSSCGNRSVKNILEKISQILIFSEQNEVSPDEDTINILKESLEYCISLLESRISESDLELIVQRLEIIKQIQEFNNPQEDDFKPVSKPKQGIKVKKLSDFSEIFNAGEIKTLRVDSQKLDSLVNQVGELTVTKIKTKQHLHEIDFINKNMQEWHKDSIKALNYLKHYEKKYLQQDSPNSQVSFFVKQMLNIFADNNRKIQEMIFNVTGLQKTLQENDTKMGIAVDSLGSMVKNIRVLPLATVFHLFGRMVRDIASEKGKKIDFQIFGSETSTDKKIIEEIKTPLIHIIRNAIDHGIESPFERTALGKPAEGKIILSAKPSGNKIVIEIQDDGRGLNIEKIKEKAIQKGFLRPEEAKNLTNEQVSSLIFSPGFSTGDEITDISGRGIGLDVVQSKISQLNGKVRVLSEVDKGCCVQIELPTTMSTLMVFLVKSAGQTFAVPMDVIKKVLKKNQNEIILNKGRETIIFRGKPITMYNLADLLCLDGESHLAEKQTVLIIESDDTTIALAVDKLIGDQEILHKKLSAPFYKLKNISGITTLVSGEVCLILNISDIIKSTINSNFITLPQRAKLRKNSEYKILLVDDSITTRTMEKNILTKFGYEIELAQNPVEAFDKMSTARFDLIISDIEMPEMDGLEFLRQIKSDEMYADIPVIMLSSLYAEEKKSRAYELGAVKYLVKCEFNQDELKDIISKIFSEKID